MDTLSMTTADHDKSKLIQLEQMKNEMLSEIVDIDCMVAVIKERLGINDSKGGSVVYIGCHTNARTEHGEPKFKVEEIFKVGEYTDAVKLVRGLKDVARGLAHIKEGKRESFFLKLSDCMKELNCKETP